MFATAQTSIEDSEAQTSNINPNGVGGYTVQTLPPLGSDQNYTSRISPDRTQMQIDDRVVNLSPGMAVTVEIKTGSRTMLSYLLSPLLRYRQETLRER